MPSSASGEMTCHLSLSWDVRACSHSSYVPALASSTAPGGLMSKVAGERWAGLQPTSCCNCMGPWDLLLTFPKVSGGQNWGQ